MIEGEKYMLLEVMIHNKECATINKLILIHSYGAKNWYLAISLFIVGIRKYDWGWKMPVMWSDLIHVRHALLQLIWYSYKVIVQ